MYFLLFPFPFPHFAVYSLVHSLFFSLIYSQVGSALYLLLASIQNTRASNRDAVYSRIGDLVTDSSADSNAKDINNMNSNNYSDSNSDCNSVDGGIDNCNDSNNKHSEDINDSVQRNDANMIEKLNFEIKNNSISKTSSKIVDMIEYPKLKDLTQFLSFCGPLFFVLLMKAFSWSYTTYACSPSGPVSLAAHQIVLNIFVSVCV